MNPWLCVTLAVICWSSWGITQKLAVKSISPLMIQLVSTYIYSALAPLLFMFMKVKSHPMIWTSRGIMWATISSLLSLTAAISFLYAAQHKPINQITSVVAIYPAITCILSWVILKEEFVPSRLFGIVIIIIGTLFVIR
jgi:drug/metabolite transporter (DMT)-like permease